MSLQSSIAERRMMSVYCFNKGWLWWQLEWFITCGHNNIPFISCQMWDCLFIWTRTGSLAVLSSMFSTIFSNYSHLSTHMVIKGTRFVEWPNRKFIYTGLLFAKLTKQLCLFTHWLFGLVLPEESRSTEPFQKFKPIFLCFMVMATYIAIQLDSSLFH